MAHAKRLVRLQAHGQLELPAEVRRKHNLKPGDLVAIEDTDLGVLLTPQAAEEPMTSEVEATLFAKPDPEEITRRQALFARVMARRHERAIRPLTSADLVHLARGEEETTDDPGA